MSVNLTATLSLRSSPERERSPPGEPGPASVLQASYSCNDAIVEKQGTKMFSFPSKKSTEESAGTAGSAGRTLPTQTSRFRVIIPALFLHYFAEDYYSYRALILQAR